MINNEVVIENKIYKDFFYKKSFDKILNIALDILKIKGKTEVNLIIINNEEMKKLCKKYKNKNEPTDILSFPTDWKKIFKIIHRNILGDIFMSYEKIIEQANNYGHSDEREWTYLFAHGIVHLLGFDHQNKKSEKKMNNLVNKIIKRLRKEEY